MQCPKCLFEHADQITECPKCGLIFAKYASRNKPTSDLNSEVCANAGERIGSSSNLEKRDSVQLGAVNFSPTRPDTFSSTEVEEARRELKSRAVAVPMALLIAGGLVASSFQPVIRLVVSMWVHECGHAVTAWLCGFGAFPGPWRTPVSEGRFMIVTLALFVGLSWVIFRASKARNWYLVTGAGVVIIIQLVCTFLPVHQAQALITFGGDGGALILGTLLMAAFYAPRESAVYQNNLRWGFLAFGAGGFMDPFLQWWTSRSDVGRIPFGEIEGVNFSDPTLLVDQYGWAVSSMVGRYVWLGLACLCILIIIYITGVMQSRTAAKVATRPAF